MRREAGRVQPQYFGSFGVSLILHALLIAALIVGVRLPLREAIDATAEDFTAVQAVVVDAREFDRAEREKRLAEQRRLAAVEAERRRAAEDKRKAELAKKEEQQRQETLKREEAAKREAEIKRQQEEKRKAEEERRRRELEAKQAAEAEAKRQADAEKKAIEERRRAELEAEAKRIEAERQAREAAERKRRLSGLEQQYIAAIRAAVMRNWLIPSSYQSGWQANIFVRQAPGGYIHEVRIERCTGDEAFCRSVEAAVRKAEPLPAPPDPELFARDLRFIFDPQ